MRFNLKNICLGLGLAAALWATPAWSATPAAQWDNVQGSYVHSESSQYSNGKLSLKPLSDSRVLFYFSMMAGSEKEDYSCDFDLAGVCLIDEDGVGTWTDPDGEWQVTLTFTRQGNSIVVTQKGELPISVEGTYDFLEKSSDIEEKCNDIEDDKSEVYIDVE